MELFCMPCVLFRIKLCPQHGLLFCTHFTQIVKEFQVNNNFELPCFSNDLQINVRRNTYFCLVAPLKTKFLPQISCEDKKLLQIMCYTQTDALKQKVKTEG